MLISIIRHRHFCASLKKTDPLVRLDFQPGFAACFLDHRNPDLTQEETIS